MHWKNYSQSLIKIKLKCENTKISTFINLCMPVFSLSDILKQSNLKY